MRHEVVLDPETGLPEVRASRTPEGQLVFRYHTIRSGGGMSVWEPVQDVLPAHGAGESEAMTGRIRSAQLALAKQLAAGDAEKERQLLELRDQLEATEALLTEERAARALAEAAVAPQPPASEGDAAVPGTTAAEKAAANAARRARRARAASAA